MAYIAAFLTDRSQETGRRHVLSETRQCKTWQRPQPSKLKVNSEGAFDNVRRDGARIALRNLRMYASLKIHPKNPMEKRAWRKEHTHA